MAFETLFFFALCFLIVGNGAFKPNISTQVGSLYPEGDPRRDGAFTIFYMGINLGAFFSPLVWGTLGQTLGWHWGFGAAGVGMLAGLAVYLWGQVYVPRDLLSSRTQASAPREKLTPAEWKRVGALVVLCALNIVFWGVYEQQGNTMQLWADQKTDWHLIPGVNN
jgi:POT family proton-dependent oligopeptide transporter